LKIYDDDDGYPDSTIYSIIVVTIQLPLAIWSEQPSSIIPLSKAVRLLPGSNLFCSIGKAINKTDEYAPHLAMETIHKVFLKADVLYLGVTFFFNFLYRFI